jgi:hypothetical protein
MDVNQIEINNNVEINELHDNKTWIHGDHKNDIHLTIFIVTIQGYQLKYTLDAINKLPTNIPFIVNVIMNISPTSKAYNEMRVRCTTDYFVQLDEDMVLFQNAIEMLSPLFSKRSKNIFLYSYYLIDEYLGIGPNKLLEGLKLYNNHIMKFYPTSNDLNVSVSSVDRTWHKNIENDGFLQRNIAEPIGYHAKYRKPFDLMIRYCKSTQSLLNSSIKKNSGDICRFIKPIQTLAPFNFITVFDCIVHHFLKYDPKRFSVDTFNRNFSTLLPVMNKYIPDSTLRNYSIDINRFIMPNYTISNNCVDFNYIFTVGSHYIFDIFCIIGIVNVLFNNYEYSFSKYPYEIYNYFLKVFKFTICITSRSPAQTISSLFEKYDTVTITNDTSDPSIDCFISVEDSSKLCFTIDKEYKQFENAEDFVKFVLNRSRKEPKQKIVNIQ